MTAQILTLPIEALADCELHDSSQLLELTLRAARAGTWAWDLRTNESVWSSETWRLHGVEGDHGRPSFETWLALVHPDDRAMARATTETALQAGQDLEIDFRITRPSGETRWLSTKGRAIHDSSGHPLRIVGIVCDVTEKKLAAEKIRFWEQKLAAIASGVPALISYVDSGQAYRYVNRRYEEWFGHSSDALVGRKVRDVVGDAAYAKIEEYIAAALSGRQVRFQMQLPYKDVGLRDVDVHYVPRRDESGDVNGFFALINDITDLKAAEQQLRDSSRQKDELLAIVGHELRNPLNAIDLAAQILQRETSEHVSELGNSLRRQTSQLNRLADDILDASRLNFGKIDLRLEKLEIKSFILASMESCESLLQAQRHRFDVTLPDQPMYVSGDSVRLSQCVSNLLTNAAKFQRPGGRVALTASATKDHLVIKVRDDGIGFNDSGRANLFRFLSQGRPVVDRSLNGLGIGLALTSAIVAMHNGEISAVSRGPGEGSEFCIRLPLAS